MTEAERRVWQILRSHQMKGYKFRRQVPIGRYIADDGVHETIADELPRITPTQTLPHQRGRA